MQLRISLGFLGLAAGAIGLVALGWVFGYGAKTGLWRPEAAAWIQTLGTFIALGVAIAIPRFTQILERNRARQEALTLAMLLDEALQTLATFQGGMPRERPEVDLSRDSYELSLELLWSALKEFPIERTEHMAAATTLRRIVGAGKVALDGAAALRRPSLSVEEAASALTMLRASQKLVRARVAQLQALLGPMTLPDGWAVMEPNQTLADLI